MKLLLFIYATGKCLKKCFLENIKPKLELETEFLTVAHSIYIENAKRRISEI